MLRSREGPRRSLSLPLVLMLVLLGATRADAAATGFLEVPQPDSFQGGVGVSSGWVCDAETVTIVIDGTTEFEAAYGTPRGDTAEVCGDTDNGFALLINWNLLGDGVHTVVAYADGMEIGRATFVVTTFGTSFLRGAAGRYLLPDFEGRDVLLEWQEAAQRFVLVQDPETRPAELVETLSGIDVQARMVKENFPAFVRDAAERLNPEIVELIAAAPGSLPGIFAAFEGTAGLPDDLPLSLLAYALEVIGDPAAVPVLVGWLERNLFSDLLWAPDFATHTLKVLTGQSGLDGETYSYDIDEKLDAIAEAGGTVAGASAATAAAIERPQDVPGATSCAQKLLVTGVDASGQQRTVSVPYTTHALDIHEQIERESDADKRARLEAQVNLFRSTDEDKYGGTTYVPIPGEDVSTRSNCGGSVTERIINALAGEKDLPVHLGPGTTGADAVRDLAREFGDPVGQGSLDRFTVIAHEYADGRSAHVEIPIEEGDGEVVVYSKDVQGIPRQHTVPTSAMGRFFDAVKSVYDSRPNFGDTTTRFYRLDPERIVSVVVDSSGCPCNPEAEGAIPVAITEPAGDETEQRVVDVAGTVGEPSVQSGTLRLNGSAQPIEVDAGGFAAEVVLSSGDNDLRVTVDAADGRRGCAERTIRSTTPRTTISATLTWNLARSDVDLYVTQPDGETSWYANRTTAIGGRLDVDNTSGFGPENYFLSSEEGDTIVPGPYVVRVHYYSDHDRDDENPTRVVTWRVVVLVNEGTPAEERRVFSGTLGSDLPDNSSPGSAGPDWADVTTVQIEAAGEEASFASPSDAGFGRPLATGPGVLEIPFEGGKTAGIGAFTGWFCDAETITVEVDGGEPLEAGYGTPRGDTAGVCGDENNGFGLLFNWSLLGDGGHVACAFADGVEFACSRFVVTTLGERFVRGAEGTYVLADFEGRDVTVSWQEPEQSFAIVAVDPAGQDRR